MFDIFNYMWSAFQSFCLKSLPASETSLPAFTATSFRHKRCEAAGGLEYLPRFNCTNLFFGKEELQGSWSCKELVSRV